jgi:hypothetical protein
MNLTKKQSEKTLLQHVEEATALLRAVPVAGWAWYFCGTLLFVCVFLHFCNDMGSGARAMQRMPAASLALAACYVLMKVCHAVFGDHLLRQLQGEDSPAPLSFRARLRLVSSQALIHCLMPWILPLSLAAMLPFGWAFAAFHNASVLSLSVLRAGGRTRDIIRTATVQSHYRQGQNHGLLIILFCFSLAVWLNLFIGLLVVSSLANSITGETNFITRNPLGLFSTSVMATTICASYVLCAPFVKAAYALRCFHSLSRKTGQDLMVSFKRLSTMSLAVGILFLGSVTTSHSQEPVPPPALDRSIKEVMQEDAFQWRMPRDADAKPEGGWLHDFMKATTELIKDAADAVFKFVDEYIARWLRDLLGGRMTGGGGEAPSGTSWASTIQTVLWLALGVLGAALLFLLYRQWRNLPPASASAAVTPPEINLESDAVVATQLPEQEWLRLAQEKIASGDYRLAMRALFLATLAHLGEKRFIAVSRWKSNGDYKRELRFRARTAGVLHQAFDQSVGMFDRAWYGWHDVTKDNLDHFMANHQTILQHGTAS